MTATPNPFRHVLAALLVSAGYYFAAEASFALQVPSTRTSIIWAPNAVLLIALLLTPLRTWWIWLVGALPAHLLAQSHDDPAVLVLLRPFLADVAQVLIAALGLRCFTDVSYRLDTLRSMSLFILVAVIGAPAIVSLLVGQLFVITDWEADNWLAFRERFLSNLTTGLIIAPLMLMAATMRFDVFGHIRSRRYGEFLLLNGGVAGALYLSTTWSVGAVGSIPLQLYTPLPFLLWAALRFGPSGLCLSLLFVAVHSILETINGRGPYSSQSPADNVLALQISLAVLATPLMLLAAMMDERKSKEKAIRESEECYRTLAEAATDVIITMDQDSTILFANPAVDKIFGYSPSELIGRKMTVLMPESLRQRHEEGMRRYLKDGKKLPSWEAVCFPGLHKNGQEKTMEISFAEHRIGKRRLFTGIMRDATERQRAQQALSESEARFRLMADAAPVMIWISGTDMRCTYFNRGWVDFTGRPMEQLLGDGWAEDVHPDDYDRCFGVYSSSFAERQAFTMEYRLRRRDGEYRWIIDNGIPRFGPDGGFVGYIGSAIDITDRKNADEALRESEERLRRSEKFSLVMVTHTDLEGRWLKVPPRLCELLGYTEKELLGMRFQDVTHPDDLEANTVQRLRLLRGEIKSFDLEKRYIRKDGEIVWVYLNVSIVTDFAGTPMHFRSYIRDISGRKRREEALRESEARLKLAMESARIGYWETVLATGQVTTSASLEQIFGLAPGSFAGTVDAFNGLVHPEDRERLKELAERCIKSLGTGEIEYRVVRPDGTIRWIAGRGQVLPGPDGRASRVLGMAVDITERKHAEEQLQATLEEVRRLNEQTEAENIYLREEVSRVHRFGELIGRSEAMRSVVKQAEQVAPTDITVLICGETGTGKELIARAIHAVSKRKDRPLVKVNCAALPASLIETELFGHEKGAFTGAATKRVGRFELADGATIFLDEIGELPLELQAKLLRFLQEGEFERLGSSRTIKVHVRVIAATNRELRAAVRDGRFREDLYYRLNVYPINLPPLREHKEDIGPLAAAFLVECERRLGRSFSGLPQGVLCALRNYNWPGNVRELQNVIERAAVRSTGRTLHLPREWETINLHDDTASDQPAGTAEVRRHVEGLGREEVSLQQMERTHILNVLERTHWRIEGGRGAAAILGMKPSTLRSRMNKLGIRRRQNASADENRPSQAVRTYN